MAVAYSQNGVIVRNIETPYNVIGGRKYKTVIMPDGKEWLAENLDFELSSDDKYYNNDESTYGWNGRKYGLLYSNDDCGAIYNYFSKFYPEWRLPTESDWNGLLSSVNNDASKLKSTQYWPVPGTDDYGFNAMPSGFYDIASGFYADYFVVYIIRQSGRTYLFNIYDSVAEITSWTTAVHTSIRLVRDAT